jgi:SAM-dependent methyltransferase
MPAKVLTSEPGASSQSHSMEQIKAAMRSTWMAGDFGVIAGTIAEGAVEFVQRVAPPAGAHVLDVACGTGNVTVPLAKLGAVTTGVDIAPNLLVQARERAAAEGLEVRFDEGDAEALPYPDASFDYVFSMFGAMFAPRPSIVAAELARVLKPGGTLAMANWNPGSFSGAMFRVGSQHAPPPPGLALPVLWGDDAAVRERLASGFDDIRTEIIPIDFDLPMSPADTVQFFRRYFGPTQIAFKRVGDSGEAAFTNDLETLWSGANTAADPSHQTLVPNEYLQVIARRHA